MPVHRTPPLVDHRGAHVRRLILDQRATSSPVSGSDQTNAAELQTAACGKSHPMGGQNRALINPRHALG